MPALEVPAPHPTNLAVVPTDRCGRRPDGHPRVEMLQRQDPTPRPRRQLGATCLQRLQFAPIGRVQGHAAFKVTLGRDRVFAFIPTLRSNRDPRRKTVRITTTRSEH